MTTSSTRSVVEEHVVLPVGRLVGAVPGRAAGSGEERLIALGDAFLSVSLEAQDLWWHARFLTTTSQLSSWATADGISGVEEILDGMVEAGLLTRLPEHDSAGPWLHGHRLLAQGTGTGADAEAPDAFVIRDRDMDPVAALEELVYAAWTLGDGRRSLADTVTVLSRQGRGPEEQVAGRLLLALPALLEAGVVLLDVVP